MRGDEARVVDAFCIWLERDGWETRREQAWAGVVAERGEERLFAEAKGRTSSTGLDVDTLYGQLLRRMIDGHAQVRYAVVVPEKATRAALRVPATIRQTLGIDIYEVRDDDSVHLVPG